MKVGELQNLRNFLRFLGESRARLLFDILPDIQDNLNNPESIHYRFALDIQRIFHEYNLALLPTESFDIRSLLEYQRNLEMRWRRNAYLLSPHSVHSPSIDTHDLLDLKSYLEMLEIRHIAVKPWISDILEENRYSTGFDLGGGPGTALRLLKESGIIKIGYLVDRMETIEMVSQMPCYKNGIDGFFQGDLTSLRTWERLAKDTNEDSLFILSDVIHGRSLEDRKIILTHLANQKGTKIIREFHGFSELDSLLFKIQIKLFTNGDLLSLHQFNQELSKLDLYFQCLHNSPYYYIGKVEKCDEMTMEENIS